MGGAMVVQKRSSRAGDFIELCAGNGRLSEADIKVRHCVHERWHNRNRDRSLTRRSRSDTATTSSRMRSCPVGRAWSRRKRGWTATQNRMELKALWHSARPLLRAPPPTSIPSFLTNSCAGGARIKQLIDKQRNGPRTRRRDQSSTWYGRVRQPRGIVGVASQGPIANHPPPPPVGSLRLPMLPMRKAARPPHCLFGETTSRARDHP